VYPARIFFFLIAYTLFSWTVQAQSRLDSLTRQLKTAHGEKRFEVLFLLAYENSDVNDSLSLIYSKEAYNLALRLADSVRIIRAGRITSGELRRTDRIDEAIELAEYVLSIAKRHNIQTEAKLLLNSLAISYSFKSEYDKALKLNLESLVIREAEGNKKEISIALNNIGYTYYKLYNWDNAITYYKRSIDLKNEAKDTYDLDRAYINLGLAYNARGDYGEGSAYIKKGLKQCGGNCSDQIILEGEYGLGVSLFDSKLLNEAEPHFKKAYEVAKRVNNIRFQIECLLYFSKFEVDRKQFDNAINYLHEAEWIARRNKFRSLQVKAYELYYLLYGQLGDFRNKSYYQEKYIKLQDSVINANFINNLTKVQTAYAERENIKTIAKKDQLVALQKEMIKQQQRQYIFIFAITCLVMTLAAILLYFTKHQQKINRELSAAKNKIEEYNRILEEKVAERTQELSRANEDLDYFIYKTSHDIRGPLLTLKGLCNVAMMDIEDKLAIHFFSKFDLTIDKLNITLSRLQIVNLINTSELTAGPIHFQAMIDDIFAFERKKGIPPRLTFTSEVQPGCQVVSDYSLVKIILENLIDNAIKFYNSSERINPFVKVSIAGEGEMVKILVEDNGIGIDANLTKSIFKMFVRASERSEIGGIGLYLSRLAAEKMKGKISVLRSDNNGTLFSVVLPVMPAYTPVNTVSENVPDPKTSESTTTIM